MSISTTASSALFVGNGTTQGFPCNFRIFDKSNLSVSLIDAVTLMATPIYSGTDWSVTGENDDSGFTLSTNVPVATGKSLLVQRVLPYTQPTSFTNQGSFFPTMHQDAFDRTEMQIQQLADGLSRAFMAPVGASPAVSNILPVPLAGALLGWSSDRTRLVNYGPFSPDQVSIIVEAQARIDADTALSARISNYNGLPVSSIVGLYTAAQNNAILDVTGSLTIPEIDGNLSSYSDHVLRGSGRVFGLYRKNVIPADAPGFSYDANDLLPKHVPKLNAALGATVVLVGDSISTYYANSNGNYQTMLTELLRTELRNQFNPKQIAFYDRSIGGQNFAGLDGIPGPSVFPEWYTTTTNTWLSYIQALSPDTVVLAMGMNPQAAIRTNIDSIVAKIKAWTKVPDIVFCTNLCPNSNPNFNTIEEQEARDRSAGLVRSYAKRYGYGLLDFHRAECMARDGFDPTQGYIQAQNILTAQSNGTFLPSVYSTFGFVTQLNIDSTKIPAAGATYQPVVIKYGYGSDEVLHIYKDTTLNQYHVRLYYGNTVYGDSVVQQIDQIVTLNNISGTLVVKVERYGKNIAVFDMVGAYNTGADRGPVFEAPLVSMGSRFQFSAAPSTAGAITSCSFGQAYPVVNVPAIKSSVLFGNTVFSGTDGEFGGQGYNHPSSHVGWAVYTPVLRASIFAGETPRVLTLNTENYTAYVNGTLRAVTRNFGRLAVAITAAGTFAWSTALPTPAVNGVLSARCSLGSLPTGTVIDIYNNAGNYASLGAKTTADGAYTTTSTSGTLLIDWEVLVY